MASSSVSFQYETSTVFRHKAVFTNAVASMFAWTTSSSNTKMETRAAIPDTPLASPDATAPVAASIPVVDESVAVTRDPSLPES